MSPTDRSIERWYLRIDGKEYGPVSRSEMESFLRPPRICSLLHVMCSTDEGRWYSISRSETIDKVLLKVGIQEAPAPVPLKALIASGPSLISKFATQFRDWFEAIFTLVARFRIAISVVLGVVGLSVAIAYAMSDGLTRERQIFARFEAIWSTAKTFDTEKRPSAEWRDFADNAIAEIDPIVKELQRSTDAHRPARHALLLAGRDGLLKLLREGTPKLIHSRVGTQIDVQLKQAQKSLKSR